MIRYCDREAQHQRSDALRNECRGYVEKLAGEAKGKVVDTFLLCPAPLPKQSRVSIKTLYTLTVLLTFFHIYSGYQTTSTLHVPALLHPFGSFGSKASHLDVWLFVTAAPWIADSVLCFDCK